MKETLIRWIDCQIAMFLPETNENYQDMLELILEDLDSEKPKNYSKSMIACAKLYKLRKELND